jgi:sigma-B regulation protein RsbU (phosphoserine phosphatase)
MPSNPAETTPIGDVPGNAQGPMRLSIHAFLTDGSLSRLCRELSGLTGLVVQLRDEAGRLIVPDDSAEPGANGVAAAWRVLDLDESGDPPEGSETIPLEIEGQVIATLVMGPGQTVEGPGNPDATRAGTRAALELLAATGSELCRDVLDLRHRVKELSVLYRLSALLVARTPVDTMLGAALDAALTALELDAGSIVLLPEDADGVAVSNDEADLVVKASSHLSNEWLHSPMPLSRGRLFDRITLNGEVLVVDDLLEDQRVMQPERCEAEGIRSFISAPMIVHERPIGLIRLYSRSLRRFSPTEVRLLRSIGEQAATAVHQARLLVTQKHERRMERQLRLASAVQHRMLPREVPSFPGIDVAARSLPSYELAGDFYDLFEVGGALGVVVGDVVGKGVAAALLMSAVRASLRAHVENVYDLDDVLGRVNRAMCADTLDNEFATLWYGVLDPGTHRLTYTSAGHDPPFVVRRSPDRPASHDDVHPLAVGGLVLGIDPAQAYPKFVHDLRPGDVLIALTDGVADARNFENEKFGWNRIVESVLATINEKPDASAGHILEQVFWTVRQFVGLRRQVDDETLVVLRIESTG